jgi:hypothetical protein
MGSDWLSEKVTLANRDSGIFGDSEGILFGLLGLSRCDPICCPETSVTNFLLNNQPDTLIIQMYSVIKETCMKLTSAECTVENS